MNTNPALVALLERIEALRTEEGERALTLVIDKFFCDTLDCTEIAIAVIAHILGEG